MKVNKNVIGIILILVGLFNIIRYYLLYREYIKPSTTIEDERYRWEFKNFPELNRLMTPYEKSEKKESIRDFSVIQMEIGVIVLVAGILILVWDKIIKK